MSNGTPSRWARAYDGWKHGHGHGPKPDCSHVDDYGSTVMPDGLCILCGRTIPPASRPSSRAELVALFIAIGVILACYVYAWYQYPP